MAKRRWRTKLLVFFGSWAFLGLLLLAVELVCRLAFGQPREQNPYPYLIGDQIAEYVELFHWRLIPRTRAISPDDDHSQYRINKWGFRGPQIPKRKGKGVIRILFMGDSSVFGWRTSHENSFPGLLQRYLSELQPDRRIEVINAGVIAYSSYQGRLELDRWLAFDPDVALFSFGWNDSYTATPAAISDDEYHKLNQFPKIKLGFKLRKSALITLLTSFKPKAYGKKSLAINRLVALNAANELLKMHAGNKEKAVAGAARTKEKYRVSPDEYDANIEAIITKCRALGVRPALTPISVPGHYLIRLREAAQRLNVPIIETEPLLVNEFLELEPDFTSNIILVKDSLHLGMRSSRTLFFDDCHPRERGLEVIARAVRTRIGREIVSGAPLTFALGQKRGINSKVLANDTSER